MTTVTMNRDETAPHRDLAQFRADFPILRTRVNGQPLTYLDNAATTQKPDAVIDAEANFYRTANANVHRGVHALSQRATDAHETARHKVRSFINARADAEIIFVRGATDAINLVAQGFAEPCLTPGDEIIVSALEHHSNIVPWQMACRRSGAVLRVVPVDDSGEFDLDAYAALLNGRTRIVAVTHLSNALGTITPVRRIIDLAHARGVPVLLDGAQAISHLPVDVRALDCDFYAFSAHKLYGPTGIGVLYGKTEHLQAMTPCQGGGDMIRSVSFDATEYNELPYRLEAGTPHIAGVVGLGAALDYVSAIGIERIAAHERELLHYATQWLADIPGLRIVGTAAEKASILSFTLDGIHPHDIGTMLDDRGIAIRAGHHCAMPLMQRLGITGTARASFALYNTHDDVNRLVAAVRRVCETLGS
ncbi:cysteine desulfurase [Aromatoleum petrolei]|uniref:Cysteine desulfurase n=1 Tax=Aromatoleum petrolei TaxID=76116 RepID=A0ABX1MU50_9RHOO|nr:cysteine desulfurase [Aromatoleum petrolei]NMF90118.1 SufS family cysteine desulfurase [Aromatoleum petrolei]QTQ34238.1 Cysteine desulfurase [Aromatoleum petrolei]